MGPSPRALAWRTAPRGGAAGGARKPFQHQARMITHNERPRREGRRAQGQRPDHCLAALPEHPGRLPDPSEHLGGVTVHRRCIWMDKLRERTLWWDPPRHVPRRLRSLEHLTGADHRSHRTAPDAHPRPCIERSDQNGLLRKGSFIHPGPVDRGSAGITRPRSSRSFLPARAGRIPGM